MLQSVCHKRPISADHIPTFHVHMRKLVKHNIVKLHTTVVSEYTTSEQSATPREAQFFIQLISIDDTTHNHRYIATSSELRIRNKVNDV